MNSSDMPVWPGWETVRLLGRGSFGAVYEIEREIFGHKEKAALKLIRIPHNDSEIKELISDGYDNNSITARFQRYREDIVREYSMMAEMKGCSNIVYCDDVRQVQQDDGIGWEIFIKMELLTPLIDVLGMEADDAQVMKLGEDICNALATCEKRNVLHRDVKPQNIFVSEDGTFKLGDFSVAKTTDRTTFGTKTGTFKYMAPEVYNNQPYGAKADIYSLGLVLYWALNEHRLPFLPLPPAVPSAAEEDAARILRYRGEALPAPAHGSEALQKIVLKACACVPNDRYDSAEQMQEALRMLRAGRLGRLDPLRKGETIPEEAATVSSETAYTQSVINGRNPDTQEEATAVTACESQTTSIPRGVPNIDRVNMVNKIDDSGSKADIREKNAGKKASGKGLIAAVLAVALLISGGLWFFGRGGDSAENEKSTPAPAGIETGNIPEVIASISPVAVYSAVGTGENGFGQSRLPAEKDLTAVSAGGYHALGLRADGTVVSAGGLGSAMCAVQDWHGITAVSAGACHTVGLKSDGTVVSIGLDNYGQCKVGDWRNVVAVAAGQWHTLGLRSNGTVLAAGNDRNGQCKVTGWTGITAIAAGGYHSVGLKSGGTVVAAGDNGYGQCAVSGWSGITTLAAGKYHTVGLRTDGTVVAVGNNASGQCNVQDWTNIIAIAAGEYHTVGLRSDGTVLAAGDDRFGQCDTGDWTGITAIAAGGFQTAGMTGGGAVILLGMVEADNGVDSWGSIVSAACGSNHRVGLRDDGTVAASGSSLFSQASVEAWSGITAISAGGYHSAALREDGCVLTVGDNEYGQCDTAAWRNITAVAAGWSHTLGLRADGSVAAVGNNSAGQCGVAGWTGIVAVAAGSNHSVGLRADGTVVAVGSNAHGQCNVDGWRDIIAISAGQQHTVGLRADGTVLAEGDNQYQQCDVGDWSDIIAISAGTWHTVGLRSDGTVAAVGGAEKGQRDVTDWTNVHAVAAGLNITIALRDE